jgi:CheY-like chemotaxis protein
MNTSKELYTPMKTSRSTHAKCVLVVDDDPACRICLCRVLERSGYRVLVAATADAAILLASGGGPVDLLLSDYQMPGMNGVQLARWLHCANPGIRVVLLSGMPDLLQADAGILPCFTCCAKPLPMTELAEIVASKLATHNARNRAVPVAP